MTGKQRAELASNPSQMERPSGAPQSSETAKKPEQPVAKGQPTPASPVGTAARSSVQANPRQTIPKT